MGLDQYLYVAIYSDGMGTFQARCCDCTWRSAWRRKETSAVIDGKAHRHSILVVS